MHFDRQFFRLIATLTFLITLGCSSQSDQASKPTETEEVSGYKIVCTTGMVADVVRNIVGDLAQVRSVIQAGVDPHLYQPTRNDMVELSAAQLIFYNGLHLEGKMIEALEAMAGVDKPVVAVAENAVAVDAYIMAEQETDPHVWMDVALWQKVAEKIAQTVMTYDPENAAVYQMNLKAYQTVLSQLDRYALTTIASIPADKRVLVTAHDAFNYMGKAYGIDVHGIQGLSTESEAGLKELEALVRFIVDRQLPAVFVESSVADKNVRALIEGARAREHVVVIGGTLYSDAMGLEGSYEGTYIGMIDHNVTTITRALGGHAEGFSHE